MTPEEKIECMTSALKDCVRYMESINIVDVGNLCGSSRTIEQQVEIAKRWLIENPTYQNALAALDWGQIP